MTELVIGVAGLGGGTLLAVRPDGGLLGMGAEVIARTPFHDWRIPGILLASFVGVGFTVAAVAEWRRARLATVVSMVAGLGLVSFEIVELRLMGWYLLQGVMAGAGLLIAVLALLRYAAPAAPEDSGGVPRIDRRRAGADR